MSFQKVLFLVVFLGNVMTVAAQEKPEKKVARPDIPGNFMIDLGLNRGLNTPQNFRQGLWGSRTVNLYYQYPIRFGKSKFSFNPGIGLSLERWKFTNGFTLRDTVELDAAGAVAETQIEQYNLVRGSSILGVSARKSMFVTNYLEIPVEFRFDTKPEDIARSFNVAIGGRVGVLYDAFTKLKYEDDGELITLKNKRNFGLNQIRYGVYLRFGIGGFTWFVNYNLSDTFESGKGPAGTSMNSFTAGISINGF
jgi:hypothetical protein